MPHELIGLAVLYVVFGRVVAAIFYRLEMGRFRCKPRWWWE